MSNTVQTIQASTNNAIGLMATPAVPCMLADQDHQARVTFPADGAREHTETAEAHLSDKANAAEPSAHLAGLSIVPALVNGDMVATVCPTRFCIEDHTGEDTKHLEDVGHTSAHTDVYVPSFNSDEDKIFAYVHLDQAPYSKNPKERAPYIRVEDGGNEEWLLTPSQADTFASSLTVFAGRIRALAQVARATEERPVGSAVTKTACPDGIAWCLGKPDGHADPREHRHEGPEHGLTGSYGAGRGESLVAFQLDQWDDDAPRLVFRSDGSFPDLDLTQVDELIGDAVPWLAQLIATRRRLAIELNPGKTPFAESEDKQTASAAFDLATKAIDIALAKTEGRAGMFRALRNFLDIVEDDQA